MLPAIRIPKVKTSGFSFKSGKKRELKQRWRKKKEVSPIDPDPVSWIQAHFYIPELKAPIKLYPHQIAVLKEAYRKDKGGKFIYSLVVWSDVKKSAKSTVAAAVVRHRAALMDWASIKIIANDLKQADSRVAFYFRRSLELDPSQEKGETYTQRGYTTIFPKNHSMVEAIPIDPGGEAGGNDDLLVFSELWAAKHKDIQQMWAEMTLSPTKFGYSQRWIETYAGYSGESPILEQLYSQGVKEGQHLDLSYTDENGVLNDLSDLEVYANGPMLCMWNNRPRLPWQTAEYYASEAAVLTDNEFRRLHRNEWVSSQDVFVPMPWWDACQKQLPPLNKDEPLIVAMDAAVSGDCFGMVALSSYEANERTYARVRYVAKWTPPKNGVIIYSNLDDPNDRSTPEGELRWLCGNFNVVIVTYDEYQLHDFVTRLKYEGVANFRKFSQGTERTIADKQLYDNIKDRMIEHDGNAPLREHINNADSKAAEDSKLRIIKRAEHLKIDLCVCLSMANHLLRKFGI